MSKTPEERTEINYQDSGEALFEVVDMVCNHKLRANDIEVTQERLEEVGEFLGDYVIQFKEFLEYKVDEYIDRYKQLTKVVDQTYFVEHMKRFLSTCYINEEEPGIDLEKHVRRIAAHLLSEPMEPEGLSSWHRLQGASNYKCFLAELNTYWLDSVAAIFEER